MKRTIGLAVSSAVLLTGCGVYRDGAVHPSVNDCVAAIPVGQALVGKDAHLRKLRRLKLADVQALLARLHAPALVRPETRPSPGSGSTSSTSQASASPSSLPTPPPGGPQPCVLVFSGSFSGATLASAPGISGAATGGYVVLVTTTRHPRILRTVVVAADPLE